MIVYASYWPLSPLTSRHFAIHNNFKWRHYFACTRLSLRRVGKQIAIKSRSVCEEKVLGCSNKITTMHEHVEQPHWTRSGHFCSHGSMWQCTVLSGRCPRWGITIQHDNCSFGLIWIAPHTRRSTCRIITHLLQRTSQHQFGPCIDQRKMIPQVFRGISPLSPTNPPTDKTCWHFSGICLQWTDFYHKRSGPTWFWKTFGGQNHRWAQKYNFSVEARKRGSRPRFTKVIAH